MKWNINGALAALMTASLALTSSCSDDATGSSAELTSDGEDGTGDGNGNGDNDNDDPVFVTVPGAHVGGDPGNVGPQQSELWYSSGQLLVYIQIDTETGSVADSTTAAVSNVPVGHNAITMLRDGSLLLGRLVDDGTELFHIPSPPRDGGEIEASFLGRMVDDIGIEGLYTDCRGRVYAMDTGRDHTNAEGNRLLLFTGDILAGNLSYQQISDLSKADVADIDDLGPGISAEGQIIDNPGLAIDTGEIYDFNYETGTGTRVAEGGRFGTHALGGALFADGVPRAYILDGNAKLYSLDTNEWQLSEPIWEGPDPGEGKFLAHSGLTGPLSNCETGFTYELK